jgi:DNA-binding MarR family transcriptional regulator
MVRSLSRKISQLYDDTLAPSGLRGTQFSLLVQARNAPEGPPTVSALAEQLHTDRTTMTRNLRTLQQAGFIDLVPGADARSRCVVVTPEGRARIREAAASGAAPVHPLLAGPIAATLLRLAEQRVRELCGSEQIVALESLVLGMLPVLETATQESAA